MCWSYGIPVSAFPNMNAIALEDELVLCVGPVV